MSKIIHAAAVAVGYAIGGPVTAVFGLGTSLMATRQARTAAKTSFFGSKAVDNTTSYARIDVPRMFVPIRLPPTPAPVPAKPKVQTAPHGAQFRSGWGWR